MVSTTKLNPQVCGVFHEAIELIGRRWTGAIVSVMLKDATRFCEIREAIPGISDRLLTERLKELEEHGIVVREVTDARPPQVYSFPIGAPAASAGAPRRGRAGAAGGRSPR